MTIKAALAAKIQVPVSSDTLEVALTDRGLTSSDTYTTGDQETVEKTVMDVLFMVYTQPDITEGGYSISHPNFLEKIKERLKQLATKYSDETILGLVGSTSPTVTGRQVW